MLYTNLKHIETAENLSKITCETENVLVCCGRMDPACVAAYKALEEMEKKYVNVLFFDMEFDNPEASDLRNIMESNDFKNLPYLFFYQNGKVVKVTNYKSKKDTELAIDEVYTNNTII